MQLPFTTFEEVSVFTRIKYTTDHPLQEKANNLPSLNYRGIYMERTEPWSIPMFLT